MRIMVVDDDAGTLHALRTCLLSVGFDVCFARTGPQALQILEDLGRRQEGIALLLTDLKMPGMNGLDLIRTVRETLPHLPAILVTAYGEAWVKKEVQALEGCAYLDKPFGPERLLESVAELVGYGGNPLPAFEKGPARAPSMEEGRIKGPTEDAGSAQP